MLTLDNSGNIGQSVDFSRRFYVLKRQIWLLMAKITLLTMSLTVEKKGKKSPDEREQEILDNIGKNRVITRLDLFDILVEALDEEKSASNEKKQKAWRFSNVNIDSDKRMITGIISAGEYGYETSLYNVETTEERKRSCNEAELIPHYFLMYLPRNDTHGYMILQRFQNLGVKTILVDILKSAFSKIVGDYKLIVNNALPKRLFDDIINRVEVKEVRYTKYMKMETPTDEVDNLKSDDVPRITTDDYVVEQSFKSRNPCGSIPILGKILLKLFKDGGDIQQYLVEELHLDSDGDEISLVVDDENSSRTITIFDKNAKLDYNDRLFPYFDVSDEVKYDHTGHPTFSSIDAVAKDYLNFLIER